MSEQAVLEIKNLHVSVEGNEVLRGLDITVKQGEIHALLGPNGAGKSTLGYAIMGHPKYEITDGEVLLNGENLLEMEADERSRAGLFLAFQYPISVPGVTVANFLRMALNARRDEEQGKISPMEFRRVLTGKMDQLGIDRAFAGRYLNEGFSGGEKKRAEILQLATLEPRIAILDETDSGLDIDAMRIVADGVNQLLGPEMGILVITHYQRFLNYIKPDYVHILLDGKVVVRGGAELAEELDEKGYEWVREQYGEKEVA
ncbi:MAG TPA: Fe-S cluster assembly ATPase SufC [Ardenticatenaceae bacterium]|jgi:Fe-S cluster assembly ATP-binding protein